MEGGMAGRYPLRKRQPKKQPKSKWTGNAAAGQESESIYQKHSKGKRSLRIPDYNKWKVAQLPGNHSPNETVNEHPIISRPEPPSTSGTKNVIDFSPFISKIKEAQDSSVMERLKTNAYKYFDDMELEYKSLKEVVSSLISHQSKKESLERQKPDWAFEIKALHDASISKESMYKEKRSHIDRKAKEAQHRYDASVAHCDRLKEELKNAEEEKLKCEGERDLTQAEKVEIENLCYLAELDRKYRAAGVPDAQVSIEEWERPYNESVDSVNLAKEKLSHLAV